VSDGHARQRGVGEGRAHALDVGDQLVRLGSVAGLGGDAGGRDAVEVLAADGEAGDAAREGGAVGRDGGLQGGDLIVDDDLAARGPHAQQQSRVLGDGGGDGGAGIVRGSALLVDVSVKSGRMGMERTHDGGVESRRGEAGSADEVLGGLELILVCLLGLDGSITVRRTVVEALICSGCHRGDGGREGEEGGCSTHFGVKQAGGC